MGPQATLSNCPPQDCATEAGKGYIGTGINGMDTAIGNNSTVTGIRTGSKVDNAFAKCVAKLTNVLIQTDIIKGKQKGAIKKCAQQADIS